MVGGSVFLRACFSQEWPLMTVMAINVESSVVTVSVVTVSVGSRSRSRFEEGKSPQLVCVTKIDSDGQRRDGQRRIKIKGQLRIEDAELGASPLVLIK